MHLPLPLLNNVVLVGGGHAHALLLREWAMKPVAGVHLTVINPAPTAPYTGMLPGFVAGHYERDDLDIDLVKLARFAGARLVVGAATAIDRNAKTITVPGRPDVGYDLCSINVGITSAMTSLPGFDEFGIPAKPLGVFAERWVNFVDDLSSAASTQATADVAVIGGGVGGCELAMAMAHRLKTASSRPNVVVIEANTVLPELGEKARTEVKATMRSLGIEIIENRKAVKVTAEAVHCEDGRQVPSAFTVGAAGARPLSWLRDTGLTTENGFIPVDNTLRCVGESSIFAVGDCADMPFAPRPKAGVFAVRQAPVLYQNLRATLMGERLESFDPQADYLKLISLGSKRAAADKFGRFTQGRAVWRLKDRIDRKFMTKLTDLPQMETPALPDNVVQGMRSQLDDHPPLCGGCGAKVGADILSGPLAALPRSSRNDIVRLPGDDAALLDFGQTQQVITTDTVRSFTTDPYRMAKISALHAMGDIWAMGAAPQAVLVTVTLPQLGRSLQADWLGEIMAGASEVLLPTGAEIVGGHTSMGAELSLGFSITGLLVDQAITLAGAVPGQALIVTRPIGSGVLFAAEMQSQARGSDIESMMQTLERPQGRASEILAEAGATAMTDITGFGLAGHLFGMLRESHAGAEIELSDIPFFSGAIELAEAGVRSHLHAANQVGVPIVMGADDPRSTLLFDPQTAGGMLAAVPSTAATDAVDKLLDAGFESAVVGKVVPGDPTIKVR